MQLWTTVPIIPSPMYDFKRVQERDIRFFDLNKLNKVRR
jgi:hypothetical protein